MATAHPVLELETVTTWWTWDPIMIGVLGTAALLYARGVRRLWQRAGVGHGVRRYEAFAYAAGLGVIAIALFSPIDRLSDVLFSAHMAQHELLMAVGAPLVVLGRPLLMYFWGLPKPLNASVAAVIERPRVRMVWRCCTAPLVVLAIHAFVRWVWHVPTLFETAMRHETIHAVQHATFFGSAALFWWAMVHGRYGKAGYGLSLLFVFGTALHTSILGALITLAPRLLYPIYGERSTGNAANVLEDQGLAGLIMWIPSGVFFLMAALALLAAWLGEAEKRAKRNLVMRMEATDEEMEETNASRNPNERRDRRLSAGVRAGAATRDSSPEAASRAALLAGSGVTASGKLASKGS